VFHDFPCLEFWAGTGKGCRQFLKIQTTMCNEAIVSLTFDYRHSDEKLL